MSLVETICWRKFKGGTEKLRRALESLLSEAKSAAGGAGGDLVVDLLDRYTFVDHDNYDEGIECIAKHIDAEFNLARTLLCATAADHQKDSAQRVLYDLTTAMGFLGHTEILSANRYDAAQKLAGSIDDIVLVDEFLGTGRSIIGRVRTLATHFRQKHCPLPRIHVFVIAGMDFGLRCVAPHVHSIYPFIALKPGLRGFLNGSGLSEAYSTLDLIESTLAPCVGEELLPHHGDGACEALYARKKGNCPNSVLPMFWWPENVGGDKRAIPFSRVF